MTILEFVFGRLALYHGTDTGICDSRGTRLGSQLYEANILVFSFPGAKLTEVVLRSVAHIYQHRPAQVIYLAGINDLTTMNMVTRKISLRFRVQNEFLEHLSLILRSARDLLGNEFPDMRVLFAGIIGVDVGRYNHSSVIAPHQDQLNETVIAANRLIRQDNVAAGMRHVYFTSKVHHWKMGQCQHRYFLLNDGLHPGVVVLHHWVNLIRGLHRDVSV